jgi:response regulator of citrate/malate metabolism
MAKAPQEKKASGGPQRPLKTLDIVRWLYAESPERFTVNDVAEKYGIERGEAYRRVQYMLIYQLARKLGTVEAHRAGRKETAYTLTNWGRKYATDQAKGRKKAPRPGRAAANPGGDE